MPSTDGGIDTVGADDHVVRLPRAVLEGDRAGVLRIPDRCTEAHPRGAYRAVQDVVQVSPADRHRVAHPAPHRTQVESGEQASGPIADLLPAHRFGARREFDTQAQFGQGAHRVGRQEQPGTAGPGCPLPLDEVGVHAPFGEGVLDGQPGDPCAGDEDARIVHLPYDGRTRRRFTEGDVVRLGAPRHSRRGKAQMMRARSHR